MALRIFILTPAPKPPACFLRLQGTPPSSSAHRSDLVAFSSLPPTPLSRHTVLLSVLPTHQPVPTTQAPAPGSFCHLRPKAKPHPPAPIIVLTSGFSFFPNGKASLSETPARVIWVLCCASSHLPSSSKVRDFLIHHSQSPAWHVTGDE